MSKKFKSRKQQFAINIRKNHVQAFKKQKRKHFYTPNYQVVIAQLFKEFQIQNSQKIQNVKKSQTLLKILQLKFQSLCKINFKEFAMFDEKQTSQNCSQIEIQKVLLPMQYPIRVHISFYQLLINDLLENGEQYKGKIILQQFVQKFILRNKYKQIAPYNNYETKIINLFQLVMGGSQSDDLKKNILHWVEGTQALNLIFNCLSNHQFLFVKGYHNVYTIIQIGLSTPILEKNQQTLDILQKIIRKADYDDISSLLNEHVGILINLLQLMLKNIGKQIIKKCAICIIFLLQTYDDYVYQMAKAGVGLIAAKLIASQLQEEINMGLQIFRMLTISEQKALHDFILSDHQINQSGAWHVMGETFRIYKNKNLEIRKTFSFILFNIISNGGYQEIIKLGNKINYQGKQDLVDMLINVILEQEDPLIILNSLCNIKTILYYSQQFAETQKRQNEIFQRILKSKLEVKITELSKSQNQTLKSDCQEFLNYLQNKASQKNK